MMGIPIDGVTSKICCKLLIRVPPISKAKHALLWSSKRQNSVENSSFGSEMLAQKQAVDMIEGLTYKLQMMGIPIDAVTSKIFCKLLLRVPQISKAKHALLWNFCIYIYLHATRPNRQLYRKSSIGHIPRKAKRCHRPLRRCPGTKKHTEDTHTHTCV